MDLQLNLSHPQIGEVESRDGSTGKLHLQARCEGREYLSLLCWKLDPPHWSWHFYNRKLDVRLMRIDQEEKKKLLRKLVRDSRIPAVESIRQLLQEKALPLFAERSEVDALVAEEAAPEAAVSAANFEGHSLIGYFEEINARYFNNEISVPVVWTRKSTRPYRYGITFGLYDHEKKEIRINARLNQAWVPDYFVKMVVHHEMLHVAVPPQVNEGRVSYHHKEFRQRERQFEEFKKALLWQRANLKRLMKKQNR